MSFIPDDEGVYLDSTTEYTGSEIKTWQLFVVKKNMNEKKRKKKKKESINPYEIPEPCM
jgi:hypothetical protein